ncbi:hypothetical protein KR084_010396, partial [Drosophila pseudotakahashii]
FHMFIQLVMYNLLVGLAMGSQNCNTGKSNTLQFHLVRQCQRAAADDTLALENTSSLEECVSLAHEMRGLALNYAPGGAKRRSNIYDQRFFGKENHKQQHIRIRLSVFEQPGEFFNCHVLQCPQNNTFSGMVNDSRFDYYSLYGRPTAIRNYSCLPEVGLFVVYTQPSVYLNASLTCSNSSEYTGSLAHIASEYRTSSLAQWLLEFKRQSQPRGEANVFLAYVGLVYNSSTSLSRLDFRNSQQESLQCFLYRAWDAGHPRFGWVGGSYHIVLLTKCIQITSQELSNASCVALTPQGTWQTLSCNRELPFICEIHTARPTGTWEHSDSELDIGPNAVFECNGND